MTPEKLTINEIAEHLIYASYATQRDEGVSHETCVKWGLGDEKMLERYTKELELNKLRYMTGFAKLS